MANRPHPMAAFMAGSLSLEKIYDRLRADFHSDGKKVNGPDTTFYDMPPQGMAYSGPLALQGFLNAYVNGNKPRYNLAAGTNIYVTQVQPEKNVGNLAALIFAKQQ